MNRVIAAASIVLTLAYALRPAPREVIVTTVEHAVRLDSATRLATVHAVLRNNTRDSTWFLGCLGVPAFTIERHVARQWIAAGTFPCPVPKAYRVLALNKGATIALPLRIHAPGEYRLKATWGWRGAAINQHRRSTSLPFEVR